MIKNSAIDVLCIQRFFGFDVIQPILLELNQPFKFVGSLKILEIEEILICEYPKLVIIESSESLAANKLILERCKEVCPTANIVFLARYMPISHVVDLMQCGANEIIDSSELSNLEKTVLRLRQLLSGRKLLTSAEKFINNSGELAKIGTWEFNVVHQTLLWSSITKKIHEVSEDYQPCVSNAIEFYLEGDSRSAIQNAFENLLLTGEPYDLDLEIKTSTGTLKWVNTKGNVHTVNGKPLVVYGTFQDITIRKELELELTRSDVRYQKVIEATNDVIWEYDLETRMVKYANTDTEFDQRIYSERELRFEDMITQIHPEDKQKFEDSMSTVFLDKKKEIWQCDYRIKNKEGAYTWINDNASILRKKDGSVYKLIGAARNVTATKEYLKSIERQNKRFLEIAWTQSHLLRPPVVNILGLVDLIHSEIGNKAQVEELLTYLKQTTEQLDDIVKQIVAKSDRVLKKEVKPEQIPPEKHAHSNAVKKIVK